MKCHVWSADQQDFSVTGASTNGMRTKGRKRGQMTNEQRKVSYSGTENNHGSQNPSAASFRPISLGELLPSSSGLSLGKRRKTYPPLSIITTTKGENTRECCKPQINMHMLDFVTVTASEVSCPCIKLCLGPEIWFLMLANT